MSLSILQPDTLIIVCSVMSSIFTFEHLFPFKQKQMISLVQVKSCSLITKDQSQKQKVQEKFFPVLSVIWQHESQQQHCCYHVTKHHCTFCTRQLIHESILRDRPKGLTVKFIIFPSFEMITTQTKEHPYIPDLACTWKIKSLSV